MEQNEFVKHPIIENYEVSRNGVIRNCILKNPVDNVNKFGYLRFNAGNKNYFSHQFVYECFYGVIEDGFVIDHINGRKLDNSLSNLRAITQSQNCKFENTGGPRNAKVVISTNVDTGEEILFTSTYAAGKYFGIQSA